MRSNPYQSFETYYKGALITSLMGGIACLGTYPIPDLGIFSFGIGYIGCFFMFLMVDRVFLRKAKAMAHATDLHQQWVIETRRLSPQEYETWAKVWFRRRWIACTSVLSFCALLGLIGGSQGLFLLALGTFLYPLVHGVLWVIYRRMPTPYVERTSTITESDVKSRLPGTSEWMSYGQYRYGKGSNQ